VEFSTGVSVSASAVVGAVSSTHSSLFASAMVQNL
jgi:hypothetical protein